MSDMEPNRGIAVNLKYILLGFIVFAVVSANIYCDSISQVYSGRFTYYEFDGIHVFYKTEDIAAYRELLPRVFGMPDEPLVWAFVMDYYKMDKETQPYLEAAVYLLAKYEGKPAWHCITMPVTTEEARIGGIQYLGYPKIMGEVTLKRDPAGYTGTLKLNGNTIMTIILDRKDGEITGEEKEWFEKLAGIPILNILRGQIYEPKFGSRSNLLTTSRMYPDKFMVTAGRARLSLNPIAAGKHSDRLAKVFSIKPTYIVLAYYMKNKFVLRFRLY
jgi:hypothetical protein